MRSTNRTLISIVKETLKRHGCFFKIVDECTLHLHSYLNMPPVLSVTSSGVDFSCPLAYYETDEQCSTILELCKNNRQVWYDELGWRAYVGECNYPQAVIAQLPGGLTFANSIEKKKIDTFFSYERDSIIENPESFYSAISIVLSYRDALMERLYTILYDAMPKTYTNPLDPRSLFFSSLFLYCKIGTQSLVPIDFNDVKTSYKVSRQLVFYPKLKAESLENLVSQMHASISEEIIPIEPFELLMSVTVPEQNLSNLAPYRYLCEQFNINHARINLLCNNAHSYESEIVLLRLKPSK